MKHFIACIFLASGVACFAQTAPRHSVPKTAARTSPSSNAVKLPPGVPPAHVPVRVAFSLRYQDIRIGTGKEAEPNKIYKVHYTGWLAATGRKFDSSYDHTTQVMGKDGKPELDAGGKPKMSEAEPLTFVQGFGRLIPGFDQGLEGMKVGGKRRLFIPWQLAYGAHGRPGPSPDNPGIPPKADLIFDIELVDVSDMQMPPQMRPGMGAPNGQPIHIVPHPAAPGTTPANGSAAPQPSGTPPPSSTPTTPPAEKPHSN